MKNSLMIEHMLSMHKTLSPTSSPTEGVGENYKAIKRQTKKLRCIF